MINEYDEFEDHLLIEYVDDFQVIINIYELDV
jgi:hypothetical protein